MNFKRASMPYGGTNNAIDIGGDSELLPTTLLLTLDHPDNDYTKSRPKNVKKKRFFKRSQKFRRHVFQILRDFL